MIERADIEARAREVEAALQETGQAAKSSAMWLAAGVAALAMLSFIVGRRRGRGKAPVVEVYRP